MSTWRRFGGFLIGLGVFAVALFVMSDVADQPEYGLLGGGALLVGLGIFIRVTHPAEAPQPTPRFRVLKRRRGEPVPKKAAQRRPSGSEDEEDEEEGEPDRRERNQSRQGKKR